MIQYIAPEFGLGGYRWMWLDPYLVVKGGTAKEPKAHDLAGNRQDWTPHWVDSMENK
jgi:hypothetical protein